MEEIKILVLGVTGMAGHTIALYFKEKGYDVTGYARRTFSYCKSIMGDVTDFDFLRKSIIEGGFNVIINAVGILNQDAEEHKSRAVLVNSFLPHFLSELAEDLNIKFIHMSTDCVFSGKDGNYDEHSLRDGLTFYDRSKALGEIDNNRDLTFRNSIIGPDYNVNGIGLFNWFMKQSEPISGYKYAIWTGVTTLTLAKAMEAALQQNLVGLYNLVNNQQIAKYDLLGYFNKYFKQNAVQVNENISVRIDKSLVNSRKDFDFKVPTYEQMIIEMKEWIEQHQDLYPHYIGE